MPDPSARQCPMPRSDHAHIQLAHGGGGRLMHELIEHVFRSAFSNDALDAQHDAAEFEIAGARLAMSTDSYVVHPLDFPGGDIGSLAVHGTANDLAMSGARPLYLSAGFIIEEGLAIATLQRITQSMAEAAASCGVRIVTGDTKVVDRGKGDGVFINTAGVGIVEHGMVITPSSVRPGDTVLLSGDIGRHGIAIMAVREGLAFESEIRSDSAPLIESVQSLIRSGIEAHCLRDLTRGGLATALNEIAMTANVAIKIDERAVPVGEAVRGACEVLGLDPLYVACEGRMIAFVPAADAERGLECLRAGPGGAHAAVIGSVADGPPGRVTLRSAIGAQRILDMLSGEQLPRIC